MSNRRRTYSGSYGNAIWMHNYSSLDDGITYKYWNFETNESVEISVSYDGYNSKAYRSSKISGNGLAIWNNTSLPFNSTIYSSGIGSSSNYPVYIVSSSPQSIVGLTGAEILNKRNITYYDPYPSLLMDLNDSSYSIYPGTLMLDEVSNRVYYTTVTGASANSGTLSKSVYEIDTSTKKVGRFIKTIGTATYGSDSTSEFTMTLTLAIDDVILGQTRDTYNSSWINQKFNPEDLSYETYSGSFPYTYYYAYY